MHRQFWTLTEAFTCFCKLITHLLTAAAAAAHYVSKRVCVFT